MQSITYTKANRPIIYNKVKAVTAVERDSEFASKAIFSVVNHTAHMRTFTVRVLVHGLHGSLHGLDLYFCDHDSLDKILFHIHFQYLNFCKIVIFI